MNVTDILSLQNKLIIGLIIIRISLCKQITIGQNMENIENSIDTMQAFHNVNAAYDHDSD